MPAVVPTLFGPYRPRLFNFSVTALVLELAVPPTGANVTLTAVLTLPFRRSLFFPVDVWRQEGRARSRARWRPGKGQGGHGERQGTGRAQPAGKTGRPLHASLFDRPWRFVERCTAGVTACGQAVSAGG